MAKVTLRGGNIQTKGKSLVVRNAEEVLIIVSIVPQEDARNASLDAVKAGLDKLATNYDKLLRPHAQKHGELFHRMQLDLGCGEQWTVTPTEQMLAQIKETGPTPLFLEQLHAMGRYLLFLRVENSLLLYREYGVEDGNLHGLEASSGIPILIWLYPPQR